MSLAASFVCRETAQIHLTQPIASVKIFVVLVRMDSPEVGKGLRPHVAPTAIESPRTAPQRRQQGLFCGCIFVTLPKTQ
jgi:hypothetical protein